MKLFERNEMLFTDYKWETFPEAKKVKFIWGSELTVLKRDQGNEVLYFLNCLAKTWGGCAQVADFQRLENIIRTELPDHVLTYPDIKTWIAQHERSLIDPQSLQYGTSY